MSFKKNSSDKSNQSAAAPKKSYHFFSMPPSFIMEGEITKVMENSKKKYFFTLFEDDFLYFEVTLFYYSKTFIINTYIG